MQRSTHALRYRNPGGCRGTYASVVVRCALSGDQFIHSAQDRRRDRGASRVWPGYIEPWNLPGSAPLRPHRPASAGLAGPWNFWDPSPGCYGRDLLCRGVSLACGGTDCLGRGSSPGGEYPKLLYRSTTRFWRRNRNPARRILSSAHRRGFGSRGRRSRTREEPDRMNRRNFLGGAAAIAATAPASRIGRVVDTAAAIHDAGAVAAMAAAPPASRIAAAVSTTRPADRCGCEPIIAQSSRGEQSARAEAFRDLSSGLKVTNLKVFGVSLTPDSDRPYVFVKLETNQGLDRKSVV